MKRLPLYAVLTLIVVLLLARMATGQPLNWLTPFQVKNTAWQFTNGLTAPLNLTGTAGLTNPLLTVKSFGSANNSLEVNASDSNGITFTASDATLRVFRLTSGHKGIGIGITNTLGDGPVLASTNNNGAVKHVMEKFDFGGRWSINIDPTHRTDGTDMTSTLLPALAVDGTGTNGITTIYNIMALPPLAVAPASCTAGQFWRMSNGAVCHCVTANNPENIGSAGACL